MGEDRIEPDRASREQDARMPIGRSARDRLRDQGRREQQLAARVLLAEERLEAERRRRADVIAELDSAVERRTVDVADALIAYVESAGLAVMLMLNPYWKISVHAGTTAGGATVLAATFGLIGGIIGVVVALAARWSRVALRHHTAAQVLVGLVVGAAIAAAVFLPLR